MENGRHHASILAVPPHSGADGTDGHTACSIRIGWHPLVRLPPEIGIVDVVVQFRMNEMARQVNVLLIDSVLAAGCGCDGTVVAIHHRLQQQVDLGHAEFRRLQTHGTAPTRRSRRVMRRREQPPEGLSLPAERR